LRIAGAGGVTVTTDHDRRVARELLDRGFAHPIVDAGSIGPRATVIVPAHDRVASLRHCLAALAGFDVVVVDDASADPAALAAVASEFGARVLRRERNGGAGAARNSGLALATGEFVGFVDSDCVPAAGWFELLVAHLADPKVAAVAPRVRPRGGDRSVLARHEASRSALDMGGRPELVRPGARLGFVPSATLVVRRAALAGIAFDEQLRVGEDVDLVWRLNDAGWLVRYEPRAEVTHEMRPPLAWLCRRFDYGTSAADLARRHPGRLAPASVSVWNLAVAALLVAHRPRAAAVIAGVATSLLARRLHPINAGVSMATTIVGTGLLADSVAIGHALRREWWPVGALALAASRKQRVARALAACMLGPLVLEWLRESDGLDLPRHLLLRLIEDATYGSGVLASAWRSRTLAPLTPIVRRPGSPAVATPPASARSPRESHRRAL
jgi:mycofactocin system glycosyltransferase